MCSSDLVELPSALSGPDGPCYRRALAIYDEHAFNRLPALADALASEGCICAPLLAHCRRGGEHARGCWALDLVLGM